MHAYESDIRRGEFALVETRVTDGGELDIYRAGDVDGVDIRVSLTFENMPSGKVGFRSVHVVSNEGRPIRIIDEDGASLDRDIVEALGLEMIEYEDSAMCYWTSGRLGIRSEDGTPAPVGYITRYEQDLASEPMPA